MPRVNDTRISHDSRKPGPSDNKNLAKDIFFRDSGLSTLNFLASRTPFFSHPKHPSLNQFFFAEAMTMKIANKPNATEPREPASISAENSKAHSLFDVKEKDRASSGASPEMDQESAGSSEEAESPRSVGRWKRSKKDELVHSQILRIREEDSHLGEDMIGESDLMTIGVKEKLVAASRVRVTSPSLDVVFFSRPILPCSPLGGKTSLKAMH